MFAFTLVKHNNLFGKKKKSGKNKGAFANIMFYFDQLWDFWV